MKDTRKIILHIYTQTLLWTICIKDICGTDRNNFTWYCKEDKQKYDWDGRVIKNGLRFH